MDLRKFILLKLKFTTLPSSLSSVALPLSAPKGQLESGEDDPSSTDWDVHDQVHRPKHVKKNDCILTMT